MSRRRHHDRRARRKAINGDIDIGEMITKIALGELIGDAALTAAALSLRALKRNGRLPAEIADATPEEVVSICRELRGFE